MPPKKKKRKPKQPTQRQSQKQVVNITFADKKNKRRKKRPQAKQSVKKDNFHSSNFLNWHKLMLIDFNPRL